jgi:hypothetical protein
VGALREDESVGRGGGSRPVTEGEEVSGGRGAVRRTSAFTPQEGAGPTFGGAEGSCARPDRRLLAFLDAQFAAPPPPGDADDGYSP